MRVIRGEDPPIDLGVTETTPTLGMIDYSQRKTDDFGVTTVVPRGFARRMSVRFAVPFEEVDGIQRALAGLRATAAQWIADDRFAWLQPTGFYKDFEIDLAAPPLSFCTLNVEGLAETAEVLDEGEDPAPNGAGSTLLMLRPVSVTDAVLLTSTVPENDATIWGAGIVYPLGGRVIRTGSHRVYESLATGNIGHDPLTSDTFWLDVGPTNRWAMFDEALGTVTSAESGSITVTLNAGTAAAVALLDSVAATARVEVIVGGATAYDTTLAANGGAITFLDLPAAAGTVRVTVTGPAPVSVGTLLVGELLGLGITEQAPTSGITDFSKKQVDDFGEATIVPRAWAKRMAARALISTEAIDVTADRIASVRARPVLWIGGEGVDSITVYGFFNDFSIEVGETVSKLSLSIQGLSSADEIAEPWEEDIDALRASVQRIASDGFLNAGEKPQAAIDYGALLADRDALNGRYTALGSPSDITPSHDDAAAKVTALAAYLTGLAPSWVDASQDTPIVAATYQTRWVEAYTAIAAFRAAITGRQGTGGVSGQTLELVKIYKRAPAGSPPATPTTTGTFDFSSYAITGLNNGWTLAVPAANGQPLYVSAAPAITVAPSTTDTIAPGEWAGPVIDSQDGATGPGGTGGLPVLLYARNNTGIPPATPSGIITVDLTTGAVSGALGVWSASAPDPAGGRYLYQTSAAAIATAPATTDSIPPSEWAPAKQILQDGSSPPAGLTVALVKIYKRSASAPATPSATSTFDFAAYTISGLNNGWTLGVPGANGQPLYVSAAPAIATAPATTDAIAPGEWASPVIDSQDGSGGGNGTGGFPVLIYQRNNTGTAPAAPSSTLTFDFTTGVLSGTLGAWSQSAPDPSLGKYLFQTSAPALATAPATTDTIAPGEWAVVKQIVKDGEGGFSFSLSTYSISVNLNADGSPKTGELPRTVTCKLVAGDADLSASATFTVPDKGGNDAAKSSALVVTLTDVDADGYVNVRCQYGAFDDTKKVEVKVTQDAAPAQQGNAKQTTNAMGSAGSSFTYATTPVYIMTVRANGSGQLQATFFGSYSTPIPEAYTSNTLALRGKVLFRVAGSGTSFNDFASEAFGSAANSTRVYNNGEPYTTTSGGSVGQDTTRSDLTPNGDYEVGFVGRYGGGTYQQDVFISGALTVKQPGL